MCQAPITIEVRTAAIIKVNPSFMLTHIIEAKRVSLCFVYQAESLQILYLKRNNTKHCFCTP